MDGKARVRFVMAVFLRLAAVFIGLVNLAVPALFSSPSSAIRVEDVSWERIVPAAFLTAAAGLITSEIVLKLMRPALGGRFFLRYAVMVFAMCLGGVVFGAMVSLGALFDFTLSLEDRISRTLVVGFFGIFYGGALGIVEGLILAFPLATILGLFRNED